MRPIFLILPACLVLLTGCSRAGEIPQINTAEMSVSPDSSAENDELQPEEMDIENVQDSVPDEEPTTQELETIPPVITERIQNVQNDGNIHIFDDEHLFSEEVTQKYNDYLEWLSISRQMDTAVVITTHLDNVTPEEFAKGYYQTLYGKNSSGFLVLINNDTGKDFIYRQGVCASDMRDPTAEIFRATPELVEGNYASALEILLTIGEQIPEYVFDRANAIKTNERTALAEKAKETGHSYDVIMIKLPEPEKGVSVEEQLNSFAEEKRQELNAELLLLMDVRSQKCVISGTPPEGLTSEVQKMWKQKNIFDAAVLYYDKLKS